VRRLLIYIDPWIQNKLRAVLTTAVGPYCRGYNGIILGAYVASYSRTIQSEFQSQLMKYGNSLHAHHVITHHKFADTSPHQYSMHTTQVQCVQDLSLKLGVSWEVSLHARHA